MRHAIISDIHGNADALQAVLADIGNRSIDSIVCLGDLVGYYPDPQRCIDLVRESTARCVAGNHDYAAIGKIDTRNFSYYAFIAMEWTKENIAREGLRYLRSLPLSFEFDGMFFTHSSPSNPHEWAYIFPDSDDAIFEAFNSVTHKVNFVGHTHWPSIMIQDEERIALHSEHSIRLNGSNSYLINVGSVGQPRDSDPRSCYGIFDTDSREYIEIRVSYDFTNTQKKIIENRLPLFLAERLEKGR
jgi:diadenosine tetraphosphatase ApaH/serine/threonine PP2A family protein phosphatase